MSGSRSRTTRGACRVTPLALVAALAAALAATLPGAAGCASLGGAAEHEARAAFDEALAEQVEAARLAPSREEQNPYAMRIRQARTALDEGDWSEATRVSRAATEQARELVARRSAARAEVAALIDGAGAQLDDAQDHPDPRIDVPNFVYYVSNEVRAAQKAFDAQDYAQARTAALHAHALIDKKDEFFVLPVSDSIAAPPPDAHEAGARSSGPVVCYWPSRSGGLAACSVVADRRNDSPSAECKAHGFPRSVSFHDATDAFRWYDGHCCPRFRSKR